MGLFVDTTGTNFEIIELGLTLTHPATNYDLSGQFTAEELKGAISLTNAIIAGVLAWKKTSGGSIETPSNYDPDIVDIDNENLGPGVQADRSVTFKDLLGQFDNALKSGVIAFASFAGNPKIVAVVFTEAFASAAYTVVVNGVANGRTWTIESQTAAGFTINSNANAALTGDVHWHAALETE